MTTSEGSLFSAPGLGALIASSYRSQTNGSGGWHLFHAECLSERHRV